MRPTNPLNELVNEFKSKRDALDAVLKSIQTGDDLERARGLKADLEHLKDRIDALRGADALKSDLDGYDSYLGDPARAVPFSAAGGGGFDSLGAVPAGASYLETRRGVQQMVWEDGAGVFGEAAWKAIHTREYRDAFRDYLRLPKQKLSASAMKTLETGVDDQGGYLVPVDLINRIVQRRPTPTRIQALVSSFNTSREYVEVLKLNYSADNIYTTGFRVTKTGEQAGSTTAARVTDTNLFGTIKVPVHTFMITGLVTLNMIEDAAFNPLDFFSAKFSETCDILRDDKILNGTGKMEPQGILANAAASANGQGTDDPRISVINSGDAGTITPDALINMNCDVAEQYDEDCRYVFNKTSTYKTIKTLKDLNGRYLFGYGTADSGLRSMGKPTDLDGYPFAWSQLMPNVAANAYPVIFGDLQGYTMVNRVGFSIQVLRELYAEVGQVAVVGRVRFGGQTLEPWRLRVMKISA